MSEARCSLADSFSILNTNFGVDFINILLAAFVCVDPKSVKNTVKSLVSVYAFGIWSR